MYTKCTEIYSEMERQRTGHLAQEAPRPVSSNLLKRSVKKMKGSGGVPKWGHLAQEAPKPKWGMQPRGRQRPEIHQMVDILLPRLAAQKWAAKMDNLALSAPRAGNPPDG